MEVGRDLAEFGLVHPPVSPNPSPPNTPVSPDEDGNEVMIFRLLSFVEEAL